MIMVRIMIMVSLIMTNNATNNENDNNDNNDHNAKNVNNDNNVKYIWISIHIHKCP